MIEFTYNIETRSFALSDMKSKATGFLSKNLGSSSKAGQFLGKHRTAVAGIGGSVVGAGLNRLRVKQQLKNQGVEKGSEEYKQRMRKATIGGAVAGGAVGLAADFGHRTYQQSKLDPSASMKTNMTNAGKGMFGNKATRQENTTKHNAMTGIKKSEVNTKDGTNRYISRFNNFNSAYNPASSTNNAGSNKL